MAHPGTAHSGHYCAGDQLRGPRSRWSGPRYATACGGLFQSTEGQLQYFCVFGGPTLWVWVCVCVCMSTSTADRGQVYWTSSFMPTFQHVYFPVSPCVIPLPHQPTSSRPLTQQFLFSGFRNLSWVFVCW